MNMKLIESSTSPRTAEPAQSPIDWLFGELFGRYGRPFLDKFSSGETVGGVDTGIATMKRVWDQQIVECRLTRGDIKRGLGACQRRTFVPSLPEFLSLCLPHLDPLAAYHEAVAGLEDRAKGLDGTWSHPAIYWAAMLLRVDLKEKTYSQVKDRWASLLAGQLDRGEWAERPAPRVLIEVERPQMTREEADARLRELNAADVYKKSGDTYDHKRWAKKILQRQADGDKSLLLIQIHDAQTAMGLQ